MCESGWTNIAPFFLAVLAQEEAEEGAIFAVLVEEEVDEGAFFAVLAQEEVVEEGE